MPVINKHEKVHPQRSTKKRDKSSDINNSLTFKAVILMVKYWKQLRYLTKIMIQ